MKIFAVLLPDATADVIRPYLGNEKIVIVENMTMSRLITYLAKRGVLRRME